jgi:hypothetical protein
MGRATEPGFAQAGDIQTMPELQTLLRVTVEVTPVTQGLRFYALMSSTDSTTNDVAIYTPLGGHAAP